MDITPSWTAVLHALMRTGAVRVSNDNALDTLEDMALAADLAVLHQREEELARAANLAAIEV